MDCTWVENVCIDSIDCKVLNADIIDSLRIQMQLVCLRNVVTSLTKK